MQSKVTLLPGDSVRIAAGATVTLTKCGTFTGGGRSAPTVELLVDGAECELSCKPRADNHAVAVVDSE